MNFRSLASNWPLLLVGAAFAFWIVKILRIPRDQRAHPTSRPDITSETGEGSFDLVFAVGDEKRLADGTTCLRLSGTHQKRRVGMTIALGPTWNPVSLGADLPAAFQGQVELRSIGPESDALLSAMDLLYETGLRPKKMKASTSFHAMTLGGDPRELSGEILKIKLFYEPATPLASENSDESAEEYAEIYVNIDSSARKAYVNEKDPDYRAPVIRGLAAAW